jgi:hypothetical protein
MNPKCPECGNTNVSVRAGVFLDYTDGEPAITRNACLTSIRRSKATRSEISQALAKAIAYRDCGKPQQAAEWAVRLVKMLEAEQILRPDLR